MDANSQFTLTASAESADASTPTVVSKTVTDVAGNSTTRTVSALIDTTAPTATITPTPADPDGTNGWYRSNISFETSGTDALSGGVTCTPIAAITADTTGTTVNTTCTDAAGNSSTASLLVKRDATAPALETHADVIAEATSAVGAPVSFTAPTATDAYDATPAVSCAPVSGGTFALGDTTVTCTATDDAGNSSSKSFKVTVRDTTAPALAPHDPVTAEATSSAGAAVTYTSPTASDAVDATPTVSCLPASGSTFPLGATTVTCTATDDEGNSSTSTFSVTVADTTAPVLTVPATTLTEATKPQGADVSFTPTATDAVSTPTISCSPASGSTFGLGSTPVSCTARDAAGNTSAAQTFTVTVQDTTAPALTLPANISLEGNTLGGRNVDFSPTATDIVDGTVAVSCDRASGSLFPVGTTTINCSASDGRTPANTASGSFTVTITDTTPPAFTNVPTNQILEATGPNGAAATFATPIATDIVDGVRPVSCAPVSGATFPLGTTTVSCTASDTHSNTATSSFTVTVRDTTPPTLTLSGPLSAEATGPSGAAVSFSNTANDLVSGNVAVTCKVGTATITSPHTFALGATTVNCSATDAAGNTATGNFSVTVVDTTAPVLATHANVTAEATSPAGAAVTYTNPTATDLVSTPTVSCTPASGSTFTLGANTVTCTATDGAGNTSTSSFTVTVVDTTAPVLALSANKTEEATGPNGAAVTFSNSATDLVSGSVSVSCDQTSGATFPLGTTTVTCSATDGAGNTATGSFTITVQDKTAPMLTLPQSIDVKATANSTHTYPFSASAVDTVSGAVAVTCKVGTTTITSPYAFPVGTTTVNCSATDMAGNTATGSFTVKVSYTFTGFFQPIDMGGVFNTIKSGSAVPVKFKLGGNQGTSIFVAGSPVAIQVNCSTSALLDDIEETVTAGGSSLTYDTAAGQYVYVWKTTTAFKAGTCYQLNVRFIDGTTQTAFFKFK